jgi:hypothetical protein
MITGAFGYLAYAEIDANVAIPKAEFLVSGSKDV